MSYNTFLYHAILTLLVCHCEDIVRSNIVIAAFSLVSYKGGKGYRLSKHVLTAVAVPANDSEMRFNKAHAKIHEVMQTTLSSMKRRFRCLLQLGFVDDGILNKKSNIIKACSVLHNIAQKFSIPLPPATGTTEAPYQSKQYSGSGEVATEGLKARQELIEKNFCSSQKSEPSSLQ